jgi:hypothetical protein
MLAIMRLSDNPVLRGVAFVYTWFFRSIPRYVLLGLFGTGVGFLYNYFDIGVPFTDIALLPLTFFTSTQHYLQHRLGRHPRSRACPRPPTWPRSPAPASCRSTRARARPPKPSGCRPADDAARRAAPGHAGHRAPDRQRDHRHGQGHLAASSVPHHRRAVLPGYVVRLSAASRSCPASSRRRSGTSSSARSSWSASPASSGTSAVASEPSPRRPKHKLMKIEADH